MATISKIAFSTSLLFTIVMLCTFFIGTGCEQILDEALQQKISVEEEMFSSQDKETTAEQHLPVISDYRITGSAAAARAKPGDSAFLIVPSDAGLFAWVCSEGGGRIQGNMINNSSDPVEVTISLGWNAAASGGTEVGSVTVPGNSRQQIDIAGSEFETFFDGLFAERSSEFYLFLAAKGNGTIDVTVQTLEFVLQPSHVIRREIGPISELNSSSTLIENISDISFSGTVYNRSSATMQMLLVLRPATPTAAWDGTEISFEVPAGGSVDMSQWSQLLSNEEMEELKAMLRYAGSGTVSGELFMTASNGLHFEIVSILLSGSVSLIS